MMTMMCLPSWIGNALSSRSFYRSRYITVNPSQHSERVPRLVSWLFLRTSVDLFLFFEHVDCATQYWTARTSFAPNDYLKTAGPKDWNIHLIRRRKQSIFLQKLRTPYGGSLHSSGRCRSRSHRPGVLSISQKTKVERDLLGRSTWDLNVASFLPSCSLQYHLPHLSNFEGRPRAIGYAIIF